MRPILFNKQMCIATLKKFKTQTRRCIDLNNYQLDNIETIKELVLKKDFDTLFNVYGLKPQFKLNEILWLREPAKIENIYFKGGMPYIEFKYIDETLCEIEIPQRYTGKPLRKMFPNWIKKKQYVPNGCLKEMARYSITITDIKLERLQEASHDDVYDEGFDWNWYKESPLNQNFMKWWVNTWNSVTKKGFQFEDNPYVFVFKFELNSLNQ